MVELGLSF